MNDSPHNLPSPQPPVIPPSPRRQAGWQFNSTLKLIVVVFMVLAGLVPLALIRGVLSERQGRHTEAIENITSTWGGSQSLAGPVLVIPYKRHVVTWKERVVDGRIERVEGKDTITTHAYFLPDDLAIKGSLQPERLHRGIYEALVYRATLQVSGRFSKPSFDEWKVAPEDTLWDEAIIGIAISDLRGAKEALRLKWGDETLALEPGSRLGDLGPGVHARWRGKPVSQGQSMSIPFELELTLQGSHNLRFAPFGMQNKVRLTSTCPDPSFNGAFLPTQRKVTETGFEADWELSYYARSYPQQCSAHEGVTFQGEALNSSLFGVSLMAGVDSYRTVERSIKYGVLFLAMVFAAFFLFEVRSSIRVHPVQYALVGASLCLFYLALLSLSELLSFGLAYTAGAAAATLMIAVYSALVLRGVGRAWIVAAGLTAIYGFLYVLLREQEYSLLYGTAGLFFLLGLVMYITRNIDWYAHDGK